ncbi:LysR family transcriptional regulator [Nonomuraea sp. NPDC002799]
MVDLEQVRAFVAVADELHFGRAAQRLFVTQQALSKRVRRLEQVLGGALFVRGTRRVELSEAGRRFLDPARRLLEAAEVARAAFGGAPRPLNLDVWGYQQFPWTLTVGLAETMPELLIQPSVRRGLPRALAALRRGEVDAAFGNPADLDEPLPADLTSRLVRLQPMVAVLGPLHPLAGAAHVGARDLDALWWPSTDPPDMAAFARRVADDLGIPIEFGGTACADAGSYARRLPPDRLSLAPDDVRLADGVQIVPITEPAIRYPWSIVWRRGDRNPALARLLRELAERGHTSGWTEQPDQDAEAPPGRAHAK